MVAKDIEIARNIADWYGIYAEPKIILRLSDYIMKVRAESAEQARKEAADRACRICRIISKPQCLRDTDCMTRMAILSPLQNVGNDEQVPTERNKLEIAVKTLEYFANYSGYEASGLDMRDMAQETLEEIQE